MTLRTDVEELRARIAELEAALALQGQLPDSAAVAGDGTLSGSGLAAIAQLEAERARGRRLLLVPEARRRWLADDPVLSGHVHTHYAVISDRPGSGLLLDVGIRRPTRAPRRFAELVAQLVDRDAQTPVLDWSGLGLARSAPGYNVFAAAGEQSKLPYLDATIDVVVIDDPSRMEEARRVASRAAVLLAQGDDGEIAVIAAESFGSDLAARGRVLVSIDDESDEAWGRRVLEALGDEPGAQLLSPSSRPRRRRDDLFVSLERGVVPLPGAVAAARATLAAYQVDGVAVKLIAADGTLEAAGGTILGDGSVAAIAPGADLHAPWHEFVRPVAAAVGMSILRTQRPRTFMYQPEACAVRTLAGPPAPADDDVWRDLLAQGAAA